MALQEEILAAAPSASIHGHPRKGWEPLPLEDVKPEKGAFVVKVAGQVVVSVGPEPRPFKRSCPFFFLPSLSMKRHWRGGDSDMRALLLALSAAAMTARYSSDTFLGTSARG